MMRLKLLKARLCLALSAAIFPLSLVVTSSVSAYTPGTDSNCKARTSIFYYPWYGDLKDGRWVHWDQNDHQPPEDIGSNYYPALGAYSSSDSATVKQHMEWIKDAKAGIVIISWWGKGSYEDKLVERVLDAANVFEIKVAFHIEPYRGRTAQSIKEDIEYIYEQYGKHPAFLKLVRPTKWGATNNARGVFYIFESLKIADADWAATLDALRGTDYNAIVLGQTTDLSRIDSCHFDGLYTYDAYKLDGSTFKAISDGAKARNSLFSASVGPGYVDTRAVAGSNGSKSRDGGTTYDAMWKNALDAKVEWVSITSFNEWHEGTQIEPAVPKVIPSYKYMDYEGAFHQTGAAAQNAYLDRTAHWIRIFENNEK